MKPGAQLRAAVEVLAEIFERHRPAAEALSDWGRAHRFAGSGDRAMVGNLVYDALRRRLSLAARMGEDTPRALILAVAPSTLAITPEAVARLADGSAYALEQLSEAERAGLGREIPADAPDHVKGDYPGWLAPSLARAFGHRATAEGAGLARRAPVDLRVNTLKANREKVLKALSRFAPEPTPLSPVGVRLPVGQGPGRQPNVEAEAGHGKGWFEVQDEGSQIAALMAGAAPRLQVIDLCAGAGGKTLAMAAAMQNTGQIYAYDSSRPQLRPIFERLRRAGVRNGQVLEAGDEERLGALGPRFDVVLVDAPCTGSGVWRRRPDAKWRVRPSNIAERQAEQRRVLTLARTLVRPGGRLTYVTCSVLPEENIDIVGWLLESFAELRLKPFAESWRAALTTEPPRSADGAEHTLLLTPASHGTDGFFIATFERGG